MTALAPPDQGIRPSPTATDRAVSRSVGMELRRQRENRGWSRGNLVARLPSGIGERTLLSYEHGTRQLTVARLTEICDALAADPATLLGNAMQRARLSLSTLVLRVDLRDLLNHPPPNERLQPVTRWAHNHLNHTNSDGIAELPPKTVTEMAHMIGATPAELANHLAQFLAKPPAPDAVSARQTQGRTTENAPA